jgi:hypothetical protein
MSGFGGSDLECMVNSRCHGFPIFSHLTSSSAAARGDALRFLSHPFDSPPHQKGFAWRPGLDTPQVLYGRTVSFLRARNREGNDVYFQPYAFQRNAGYILVELDRADPAVLDTMRANGHQPCVVVETSPGGSVASFEKGANEGLGSHGHHAVISNRLAMNRICLTS